ncbi:MAG TPA: hypothetical protein VFZ65_04860 [Planctomycetota bacterium]|nr:hypothetical protein [Planctomycetota bacterium]
MLLRVIATLLCLSTVMPCQERGGDVQGLEDMVRRRAAKAQGKEDGMEGKISEDEWAKLTPEQRLARNVTHGASAYCKFMAAVKPAKLMPGQTGVVVVSAILLGSAVLPAPAPMEMVAAPQQGLLSLGRMTVLPPDAGKLAKAYIGRPVYDNYAVLEVPITVSPEAEVGKKQVVSIDMRFDLYDGNSAQPVGRFFDRVTTEVEFGRVADPVVKGFQGASTPEVGVSAQIAAEPGASTSKPARDEPPARVVQGADPTLPEPGKAAPEVATLPEPRPTPPLDAGDSALPLPLPLLVGGGALLGLIVLLLARRK